MLEQFIIIDWFEYIIEHPQQFWTLFRAHLTMVLIGEFAAIVVAVPAGILATRDDRLNLVITNAGAVAQTIPPLGVIAISFTYLGLGIYPAILALFFYALFPILKNTATGMNRVDDAQIEAGRGMGMSTLQRLRLIEVPIALPVIFAGIRTSTVLCIGVAYLGAFIGAGGFGRWVILGLQTFRTDIILAGAIPGALLVIGLDQSFKRTEQWLASTTGGESGESDVVTA
jgi:osmoprotectant transport system permease protein